ncbi:MAG: transcription antitermination factor NusB [Pseudomonadota bacterium]
MSKDPEKSAPQDTPQNTSQDAAQDAAQDAPMDKMMNDGITARLAALALLEDVLVRKQALDIALKSQEAFKALPQRDRGFVRMMVSTALRRLGQVDDIINRALEKDTPRNNMLQNILRMGVTQILFMDVADHAAVDTSVRVAERQGMEKQKAFVNGLLRTVTRKGVEWRERQDEVRLNTPEWLLKIWIEDYGLGTAAEIAKANLSEAPLDITVRDPESKNFWASNFKATEMTTGTLRKASGGAVHELQGFDEGHWWVQDAAAAIPAQLFGDLDGAHVYDLCAAPGGKTLQLAAKGARVSALDRSAKRLKRLTENLERMNLGDMVEVVTADAGSWKPLEPAGYILLDAPCSATGTIRRHPDVAHLKAPQDIARLENLQAALLENAFAQMMPGGVLVYCTCSLQKAEGERQIERFLAAHKDAQRLPIKASELGGFDEAITDEGDLRILPYHQAALGGMDGFYISRLTKNA